MPPPELTGEYQSARLTVVVSAAITILWFLGVPISGRVPLLDIDLGTGIRILPQVLPFVLGYGIIRLAIEWAQSAQERRSRLASRIDFGLTLALAGVGVGALVRHFFSATPLFSWAVAMPSAALVVVGTATGQFLSLVLFGLPMIRSKKAARRLALPRVPVSVRASWRFGLVVAPTLITVVLLSPSFSSPVAGLWPWLLALPVAISLLTEAVDAALPRRTLPDGTVRTRAEFLRGLREAFDMHDAHYQLGGWDTRVPPDNAPLFDVSERGDVAAVRKLLDQGHDPNELNMHGWTALMIGVANRHTEVVQLLLARGADPNRRNVFGRTPLMFAARYGSLEMATNLLDNGARVDATTLDDATTALFSAARSGNVAVVEHLLKVGADPTIRDREGRYADQHAEEVRDGDSARVLRLARVERERQATGVK